MGKQRRWHIFILALLFSFLLWTSINLGAKYQAFINVDLVTTNIPPNKAIVDNLPKTVNVKFNGTGWQLASLYLNPNVRLELNLFSYKEKSFINLKQNLAEYAKVPFRIEAIDVIPESLSISFDDYLQKKVPVVPMLQVNCAKGYGVLGDIKTNPDSILIGGAEKIIKNIFSWPTVFQKFDDVKNDIVALLPLSDSYKQVSKLSHKLVGLDINVQMVAEETLANIEILIKNKPDNVDLSLIPSKVDVLVRSGVDYLTGFDKNLIKAQIDYKDLVKDSLGFVTPNFIYPKEIKVIRIQPNKFEYVIRKSR